MFYITGDTHGNFSRIKEFCNSRPEISKDDVMIILGDAGLNYYLDSRDERNKRCVEALPITLFCIHGNHEARPGTIPSYKQKLWNGGTVYYEERFPSILFAKDGEVYDLPCKLGKTLVAGGAYSVDKYYRLMMGYSWFPDEQPNLAIKERVEKALKDNKNIKTILTHTAPIRYEPIEWFLDGLDQSKVDKSTEEWLDKVYDLSECENWYCGHYHGDKIIIDEEKNRRIRFMFTEFEKVEDF